MVPLIFGYRFSSLKGEEARHICLCVTFRTCVKCARRFHFWLAAKDFAEYGNATHPAKDQPAEGIYHLMK
jgi:hypothetical protein